MSARSYRTVIPAKSSRVERITCDFVYCEYASSEILLCSDNGDSIAFKTGKKYISDKQLRNFRFENPTDNEVTVKYVAGSGEVSDDSVKLSGSVSVYSGNNFKAYTKIVNLYIGSNGGLPEAQEAVIKICDYDKNRTSIMLQNNGNADIWIGKDDLDINTPEIKGYKICPGGVLCLGVKCAIWATSSVTNQQVSVIEVLEE